MINYYYHSLVIPYLFVRRFEVSLDAQIALFTHWTYLQKWEGIHQGGFYVILRMISNQQIPGVSKAFTVK